MTKGTATGLSSFADRAIAPLGRMRRSGALRLALPMAAVGMLVAGLLVVLPAHPAAGDQPATFEPLAPQADAHLSQTDVALDAPFRIQFTKPMNAPSVEDSLTITPPAELSYRWDATDQTLALAPKSHWEPHTAYHVTVGSGASDLQGLALKAPINAIFATGELTAGEVKPTQMVDGKASPRTAFQLTFTRPVKYSTVVARLGIFPTVPLKVLGDDPTDQNSMVYTITPTDQLATGTKYVVTFANGGADSSGSALTSIPTLNVETLPTPAVVKFTPGQGTVSRDTNQAITIVFSVPMDTKATEAALRVTDSTRGVVGFTSWSDDHTTLTWTPKRPFYTGSVVAVFVAPTARSTGGINMAAAQSTSFSLAKARAKRIVYTPPRQIKWESIGPQYLSAERYYLELINCTRTGGWVVSGGYCSTVTRHTRPPQAPLVMNSGIADKVARPYSKYMADTCQLNHYLNGTNPHSRLAAAGYGGGSWGENIASPSSLSAGGLANVEMFYQNESRLRGNNHYTNIMNKYFRSVGVGIWVSRCIRLTSDFYG